jgi:hypothetical protein
VLGYRLCACPGPSGESPPHLQSARLPRMGEHAGGNTGWKIFRSSDVKVLQSLTTEISLPLNPLRKQASPTKSIASGASYRGHPLLATHPHIDAANDALGPPHGASQCGMTSPGTRPSSDGRHHFCKLMHLSAVHPLAGFYLRAPQSARRRLIQSQKWRERLRSLSLETITRVRPQNR